MMTSASDNLWPLRKIGSIFLEARVYFRRRTSEDGRFGAAAAASLVGGAGVVTGRLIKCPNHIHQWRCDLLEDILLSFH